MSNFHFISHLTIVQNIKDHTLILDSLMLMMLWKLERSNFEL